MLVPYRPQRMFCEYSLILSFCNNGCIWYCVFARSLTIWAKFCCRVRLRSDRRACSNGSNNPSGWINRVCNHAPFGLRGAILNRLNLRSEWNVVKRLNGGEQRMCEPSIGEWVVLQLKYACSFGVSRISEAQLVIGQLKWWRHMKSSVAIGWLILTPPTENFKNYSLENCVFLSKNVFWLFRKKHKSKFQFDTTKIIECRKQMLKFSSNITLPTLSAWLWDVMRSNVCHRLGLSKLYGYFIAKQNLVILQFAFDYKCE